jgi:gas vesicle protein
MNTGKLVLGMLAGFATGTLLGMLFSPKKSNDEKQKEKEERKNEPRELAELNRKFDKFLNGIRHDFDRIKKEVADLPRQETHHQESKA